jgi:3-isopropylmalate dehydrogenase
LRYSLGLEAEARAVEAAVTRTLAAGILTGDIAPPGTPAATTRQVGQAVLDRLAE